MLPTQGPQPYAQFRVLICAWTFQVLLALELLKCPIKHKTSCMDSLVQAVTCCGCWQKLPSERGLSTNGEGINPALKLLPH